MSNGEGPQPAAPAGIPTVKIAQDVPVVFTDGVMSHAHGPGIAKFYLYRADPSPDALEPAKNIPIAQLIMTARGFAAMLHFLEHRLKIMIADGAISQAEVDRINQVVFETPQKTHASP
jgi:hypothetical protein